MNINTENNTQATKNFTFMIGNVRRFFMTEGKRTVTVSYKVTEVRGVEATVEFAIATNRVSVHGCDSFSKEQGKMISENRLATEGRVNAKHQCVIPNVRQANLGIAQAMMTIDAIPTAVKKTAKAYLTRGKRD